MAPGEGLRLVMASPAWLSALRVLAIALLAALAAAGCGPKRADPDPDKGKDLAAHPEAAAANASKN